jgi:cytochrome P450
VAGDGIDLSTPDAVADPHSLFHQLRATSPVHRSDAHRAWLVLSHAGVSAGFRDQRLSADRIPAFERMAESRPPGFARVVDLLRGWMVFRDDPDHNRLRDPVRKAFTPRRIAALEPSIQRVADELLDGFEGGDLKRTFAAPLPAFVIADLLGIPRQDREEFARSSQLLAAVVFAAEAKQASADHAIAGAEHFWRYFTDLCEHRRRHPGDDLVSELVAAVGPGGLEAVELVGACTLLLFAGHETTTNLLTSGPRVLLDDDTGQLERLRSDATLWSTAVDELLRLEGPAKLMVRRARTDVDLDGVTIPGGDTVWLVILAADRDPAVFERPDALDVARDPNPHLAFGWGIHHCLGAPLARLEGAIALRTLFERYPSLHAVEPARWGGGVLGRGLGSLVVGV